MDKFRVVVAGGRKFNNYSLLKRKLDLALTNIKVPIAIVCGGAKGADELGRRYAIERGYQVLMFPADWDKYGKSAGYKRNKQMAMNSEATMAFWDGVSKGTEHMINLTKQHNNKLKVVMYKD